MILPPGPDQSLSVQIYRPFSQKLVLKISNCKTYQGTLRFRKRGFVIVPMLLLLACAVGASGQTQPAVQRPSNATPSIVNSSPNAADPKPSPAQTAPSPNPEHQSAVELAKPGIPTAQDSPKPAADYKASLKELSSYYERELERLAEENRKLKGLYTDGLIARVELEASDKALLDAQAKVEDMHKQIASEPAKAPLPVDPMRSTQAWTTGDQKVDDLIRNHGNFYGVDPYLIYCVMSQESSFNSGAVSPKGARGLMQLMPATAARYGVVNRLDPDQSIKGGTHYLKDLLVLFNGRVDLVLAAYNAGEGAVIKYGNQIPPYAETKSYVRLISMRYLNKRPS